jgi:hypothetical protein
VRAILALVAILVSETALAAAPRVVDYLYIEANEGGSSGGHSAIRFGDETYHFQHERPGLLRLRRDDWQHFRYAYGVLENRTLHVSRIVVSDAGYARLRQAFNARYLGERRVFEYREALRDERELLAQLLARRPGTIRVRGAGFFFPDDGASPPSAALLALRRRVLDAYGPDGIRARIAQVQTELARLAPAACAPPTGDLPDEGHIDLPYPFSRRYRDLLTASIALQALDRALPLRAGSFWSPAGAEFEIGPDARRRLVAYADRLTGELTRLLVSARPDWGFALLVGMARLEALHASEATGRLVLLDAFPPGSDRVPRAYVRRHRDALADLRAEAREDFARARARLAATDAIDEAGFAEVESAGNHLLELKAAVAEDRALRVSTGLLVPSHDAAWSVPLRPEIGDDELALGLARATAAERRFAERLHARYGYDLVRRNCVSEIFRTVEAAGAEPGGHVDTRWSFDFIPFVAARAVNATWDVVERTTLPSYRRARLADMSGRDGGLRVRLRESNVLTSTIYRRNADDSFFLFFTDDLVALRPLFGAVNLASGVGAAVAGLPLLPFDRGETFLAGVRGAIFSLPELAFLNLRKGSFDYVPREQRPPDAVELAAATTPAASTSP